MYDENYTAERAGDECWDTAVNRMITSDEINPDFKKKGSNVNHPSHYNQGGVECIEGIKAACEGLEGEEAFCIGSAIKYLWRYRHKNGREDLEKAIWYITRVMKIMDEES